jgi:hypothetical protein
MNVRWRWAPDLSTGEKQAAMFAYCDGKIVGSIEAYRDYLHAEGQNGAAVLVPLSVVRAVLDRASEEEGES